MKYLYKTIGIILALLIFLSCQKKPVPPVISTTTPTEISTTSAVSGGNITNDGGAPISSKGICWNTTTDPTIAHSKTSESGESPSFSSNITQLIPSTLYYVRAYATNSAGTSYGESQSFKTLGDKPVLNSQNASNIQLNSATLNGNVNPNSLSTTVTFEYGITINYGSSITAVQSPLTGNLPANVSVDLTGLNAGTTYHFRIKAENSLGITFSSDFTFTSLGQVPTATAQPATNLQINSATLNGVVNPNLLSTSTIFEWGLTTSYGSTVTAVQSPVTGSATLAITASLSGLTPGKTYHFRIKAENSLGITFSNDMTLTALGQAPSVTALDASAINVSSATLNGSVNPNFLPTTISFEWGISSNLGNNLTLSQNSLDGSTAIIVNSVLSGLAEGTKYYYRITATNELGTTNSMVSSFTTFAKPIITTTNISDITTISALSGGNILSDFGSAVSEKGICWSTSHNPTTSDNKVLSSLEGNNFTISLTNLIPNSTYFLRAFATNSVGTGYGNEIVVKTYTGVMSDIDGNQYYTVTLGNQLWMAQNLKTTKYRNGDPIGTTNPYYKNITSETNPKYQWAYNGVEANANIYGRLYTWYTVIDSRNLCPEGWHVPTDMEWTSLEEWLINNGYKYDGTTNYEILNKIGKSLAGTSLWLASNIEGSIGNNDFPNYRNKSGFSALPAGYRFYTGVFTALGTHSFWWTSTEHTGLPQYARVRYIINTESFFMNGGAPKIEVAYPVRCIKD